MVLNLAQYQMILDRLSYGGRVDNLILYNLKDHFRDDINSQRLFERIKTLPQLLKILGKRDVISCDNIVNLQYIKEIVAPRDTVIQNIFDNRIGRNVPTRIINNFDDRGVNERVLPLMPVDPIERINLLVRNDIGNKWKELARALHVAEGNIDVLEAHYRGYIPDMVNEILRLHQEDCGFNFELWRSRLQSALVQARRSDLSTSIDDILTLMPVHNGTI